MQTLTHSPETSLAPVYGSAPIEFQLLTPEKYRTMLSQVGYTGLALAERQVRQAELASLWETQGYIKEAPQFAAQVQDISRQAEFRFKPRSPKPTWTPEKGLSNELEGLQELDALLYSYLERTIDSRDEKDQARAKRALDMLENLTFIGAPEFEEAAIGIGQSWKAYLDADPRRQLCVITEIGQLGWYARQNRKSDDYLKDRILQTFTDEERARYAGRIVDNPDQMVVSPAYGKMVHVDDWTISGKQMSDTHTRLMSVSSTYARFADAGKVEINLITASEARLNHGLQVGPKEGTKMTLPVKAYYKAHFAPTATATGYSYISGLHSSVNYGFGGVCEQLVTYSQGCNRGLPRLSHIEPTYRSEPAVMRITPNGIERINDIERSYQKAVVLSGFVASRQNVVVAYA